MGGLYLLGRLPYRPTDDSAMQCNLDPDRLESGRTTQVGSGKKKKKIYLNHFVVQIVGSHGPGSSKLKNLRLLWYYGPYCWRAISIVSILRSFSLSVGDAMDNSLDETYPLRGTLQIVQRDVRATNFNIGPTSTSTDIGQLLVINIG